MSRLTNCIDLIYGKLLSKEDADYIKNEAARSRPTVTRRSPPQGPRRRGRSMMRTVRAPTLSTRFACFVRRATRLRWISGTAKRSVRPGLSRFSHNQWQRRHRLHPWPKPRQRHPRLRPKHRQLHHNLWLRLLRHNRPGR